MGGGTEPGSQSPLVLQPSPRLAARGIFFGLGTVSYTCVLACLAPYYVKKGCSEHDAALSLGFLTAMQGMTYKAFI